MKKIYILGFILCILVPHILTAQKQILSDPANGDWTLQEIILINTPEADMMIRKGDIDNLGFGWPNGFDPFTGNSTPAHAYPWTVNINDAMGTDRIMVITSYKGNPPHGRDGYTNSTTRPANLPRPIVLNFALTGLPLNNAVLQIFVDDFQAPVWGANYFVTLNGENAPYIAEVVNNLTQTGPVGKMITISIPPEDLYLLERDSLSVFIDDTTTGAGDGYAIDFVKLLINTTGFTYTGNINGYVTDIDSGNPVHDASVYTPATNPILTNSSGYFNLAGLPAGMTKLTATKFGYDTAIAWIDLQAGQTLQKNLQLKQILNAEFQADHQTGYAPFTVQFTDMTSKNPVSWLWDFGDESTYSYQQNPTHTYEKKGVYTVILTASDGTKTDQEKKTGYIQVMAVGIGELEFIKDFTISPNPVSSRLTISYELAENADMNIDLYDHLGQKIQCISEGFQAPGKYCNIVETNNFSTGIYYLEMRIKGQKLVKKIEVIR